MRDEFEAEGNGFIAASLINEAEEELVPAIEAATLTSFSITWACDAAKLRRNA